MRRIEVIDYLPTWPENFIAEADLLASQLESLQPVIHHIGSTAVAGLAAKPVIDVIVEVDNVAALDELTAEMTELGYQAKGENGIPGRRYFQKGGDQRSHHLHAFSTGDEHIHRHLAFRDYLRAHPDIAAEYGRLKKAVAAGCGHDSARYCAGKEDFIREHQQKALLWCDKRGR